MNVFLVDPSMFTAPYDFALLEGIAAAGADARLFGRVTRFPGEFAASARYEPFFYRRTEGRLPAAIRRLKGPLKAAEHIADMRRFAAACRRERPDVVHFQWTPLPLLDAMILDRISETSATVLTVHDTTPFNGDATSRMQVLHSEQCWRKFDHIITHTESGRKSLVARDIPPNRISVIPHGLLQGDRTDEPRAAGSGRDARLGLLFFGQIKPYKGLDTLIDAIARLPPQARERLHVRVCGQPYMDMSPIFAKIEAAGLSQIVELRLARIPDAEVDALYAAADAIVMPYHRIEASGVLSKALAHGLAVIASETGGFAEFLRHGETALLCPVGDADAFGRAIASLVADRQCVEHLRTNARRLGMATPSWSDIGVRTIELYQNVMARTGRGANPVVCAPQQAPTPH